MSDQSEILAKLDRLAQLQVESNAILEENQSIQKQAFELQQKALDNQQRAIKNQMATGRVYRISLALLALLIAVGTYFLINYFSRRSQETEQYYPAIPSVIR